MVRRRTGSGRARCEHRGSCSGRVRCDGREQESECENEARDGADTLGCHVRMLGRRRPTSRGRTALHAPDPPRARVGRREGSCLSSNAYKTERVQTERDVAAIVACDGASFAGSTGLDVLTTGRASPTRRAWTCSPPAEPAEPSSRARRRRAPGRLDVRLDVAAIGEVVRRPFTIGGALEVVRLDGSTCSPRAEPATSSRPARRAPGRRRDRRGGAPPAELRRLDVRLDVAAIGEVVRHRQSFAGSTSPRSWPATRRASPARRAWTATSSGPARRVPDCPGYRNARNWKAGQRDTQTAGSAGEMEDRRPHAGNRIAG